MTAGVSTAVRPAPVTVRARAGGPLGRPAFWLLLVLLAVGGSRVGAILVGSAQAYPVGTLTALGLGAAYAVPVAVLLRRLDRRDRQPPLLLATAFAWGALVATTVAIPGNAAGNNLLAKLTTVEFAAAWGPALAAPTVEEVVKVLGVVVIGLLARARMRGVLDGVGYGAMVGLGFQVVENVGYAVTAVALTGHGDRAEPVVATVLLRGFLAGLWSHALFGALAGAGIGHLMARTARPVAGRFAVAALALSGAWLCHALWNAPLAGEVAGVAGGLALLALKAVPPVLGILVLVRAIRHHRSPPTAAGRPGG